MELNTPKGRDHQTGFKARSNYIKYTLHIKAQSYGTQLFVCLFVQQNYTSYVRELVQIE